MTLRTVRLKLRQRRAAIPLFTLALLLNSLPGAAAGRAVERGEYLTAILGCSGCHTEGALEGRPYGDYLAGSRIGIAYTDYRPGEFPGIVFPSNLTSDVGTGIGRWNKAELVRFLQTGIDHDGMQATTVMPWINYSTLHKRDIADIAAYLLSLPPVNNPIPSTVARGTASQEAFVQIGIFIVDPSITSAPDEPFPDAAPEAQPDTE